MTFSITVPNANQSPGLFPAQNNTNFQRLKDIINNEHNFTDTSSVAQGIHKQVTLINRDTPMGLPAGNGVLYSQADSNGASQLRWYNGASDTQITGSGTSLIGSGSVALTTVYSGTPMFTLPANSFGFMYMWAPTTQFRCAYILWQTSNAAALMQMTATYFGSSASSSGAIIPIIFDNSIITQSLDLFPKTSSSSYNNTYQFRIFKVA